MDLKAFLAVVRLYWKTFVIVALTLSAAAAAWLVFTPVQYVSTTQLMVTIQGSTTAAAYQNADVVTGRVNSYIALLTSDVVARRIVDKLGLDVTAAELAAKVSATKVPPNTSVIDVAVADDSPEQARRIADAVAAEFVDYTEALETPTGEDGQKMQTTVITAASTPRSRRVERMALGLLAVLTALVLASVAVWVRSFTDPVARTAGRAAHAAGVPVLGNVTSTATTLVRDLEGYRRLRTRLHSTLGAADARVIEVVSVDGEVDTSTVATKLGRVMKLAGGRAIVLDTTGPRTPERSKRALIRGIDGLPDTYPVRGWAERPERALTKSAARLVGLMRRNYDHVLIAAPPALPTLTASALAEYADAVLLLVSADTTRRQNVKRVAEDLRATGAPLIGVVLVGRGDQGDESATRSPRMPPPRRSASPTVSSPVVTP